MAMRQKQLNETINKTGTGKEPEKPSMPPSKRKSIVNAANFKKKDSVTENKS
jgi:hypothetical protein